MGWWQHPYPGGPMVGPPFTRPLYPADAADKGKLPSLDGKDVEAVKRAVSRGGRWPWQRFDRDYSNRFSHGQGGNVVDTGMAGVQRQNNVDATGWMGEHTYNLLRSARIPEGLPHAGEPLFDARAVELLEQHRQEWGGDTQASLALAEACSWLGYQESPPGTNATVFGEWYGLQYEPWCAMFASYCYHHAGSPSFAPGSLYAYVPYILDDARAERNGLAVTVSPAPGDLVIYDWDGAGIPDHIGLFERWTSLTGFTAIEGNTSVSNDSNGGEVMRRDRNTDGTSIYFVRVTE